MLIKKIIVAGCVRIEVDSTIEAELYAVELGLKIVADWRVNISTIFTICTGHKQALDRAQWR